MLGLGLFACKKEPLTPTSVKIIMRESGSLAWFGLRLDPNMPNLCASTTHGTQSKVLFRALALTKPDNRKTGRDEAWVYNDPAQAPYHHGHSYVRTDCKRLGLSIREKTYDPSSGKFVEGSEIGFINDDCMATLTISRKPRAISIKARTSFLSQDIFSNLDVPVEQTELEFFQDCGA